eukprot:scaffold2419_cov114-Isochrysis_galbana.AAC.5
MSATTHAASCACRVAVSASASAAAAAACSRISWTASAYRCARKAAATRRFRSRSRAEDNASSASRCSHASSNAALMDDT